MRSTTRKTTELEAAAAAHSGKTADRSPDRGERRPFGASALRRAVRRVRRSARDVRRLPATAGGKLALSMQGAWRRHVPARGQGTTEYAILVGVLVVIAILAITVFRPKIQELWDAIANGINSL